MIQNPEKISGRYDWTSTRFTTDERQAVEGFLNEYPNIFGRRRIENGMNTEFKVTFIPKVDKLVYSQTY